MSQLKDGKTDGSQVDLLAAGADEVRVLARELHRRVMALQDWFKELDGAVGVDVGIPASADHPAAIVRFTMPQRQLLVKQDNNIFDFVKVEEAGIQLKIAVLAAADSLLDIQRKHQEKLIDRMAGANSRFDQFAAKVGILLPEGE